METATTTTQQTAPATKPTFGERGPRGRRQGPGGDGAKRGPRRDSRDGKPRSEYEQKIIAIRRVARVVAGGRRFSFSVSLVAGNKKGSVGVGIGKAGDTSLAIDKALKNAKKNMLKVNLTKDMSIPHEVSAKYASARVFLQPAPGRGLIAGSAVRIVLELAGIKNINAKILSGSKNRLNIARGAVNALSLLRAPRKEREAKIVKTEAAA